MAPKEVKDTYLLANLKKSFLFSKKLDNLELLRDIFTGKVIIFISSSYSEDFKILTTLLFFWFYTTVRILCRVIVDVFPVGQPFFFDVEMVRDHFGWTNAAYNFA